MTGAIQSGAMNADRLNTIEGLMHHIERRVRELPGANPIPTCPGWTVDDLANHLAIVLTRMQVRIETNADSEPNTMPSESPTGVPASEWLADAYLDLRRTLLAHDVDDPAWNWTGENQRVGWNLRRLTHELAIHLVDLDAASLAPTTPEALGIDSLLAAEGLDELFTVFLPARVGSLSRPIDQPRLLAFIPTDRGGKTWYIQLERQGFHASELEGSPDATIRGTSIALYLFDWNRPADGLSISGNTIAIQSFSDIPR
ncbi:maleylpyruvate isomerase N-terminal domain-containing protein [Ferrimicrobium sp.]|uniref:maleylpyruvate isomerase N-terminal domain-containing protein n=1 Tax=Ferrimicrobium sp. TaxID=2926050 RepID=UPI00261877F5|nr:maleylpyruvate isomerase N-terminal domain-containing protein [Ferrimicrobium sp.]